MMATKTGADILLVKDNSKNYVIKISITDLAEVERLQPQKQTYVVWMVTKEGLTKNIERLNSTNKH